MVEQEEIGLNNIVDTIYISFIKDPMSKEVSYLIKGKHYRSQKPWEATETDLDKIYEHLKHLDTEFRKI